MWTNQGGKHNELMCTYWANECEALLYKKNFAIFYMWVRMNYFFSKTLFSISLSRALPSARFNVWPKNTVRSTWTLPKYIKKEKKWVGRVSALLDQEESRSRFTTVHQTDRTVNYFWYPLGPWRRKSFLFHREREKKEKPLCLSCTRSLHTYS